MELISVLIILAGLYVGFNIGANDAANCMGTAVGAGVIRPRSAAAIVGIFALAGALLQGSGVIKTISSLASISSIELAIISALFGAALLVTLFTLFGLPVSTTQSIIGAIAGVSLLIGEMIDWPKIIKIFLLGFLTPIIAIVCSYIAYRYLSGMILKGKLILVEKRIKLIIILTGIFLAYSMGANNLGNAVGLIVNVKLIAPVIAAVLGGIAIAMGSILLSGKVMKTVGQKIVSLDPMMAFAAQLGAGLSLYILTLMSIPTSTSFAIVGGVIGVGLVKGVASIDGSAIKHVGIGWVTTPVLGAVSSVIVFKLIVLFI